MKLEFNLDRDDDVQNKWKIKDEFAVFTQGKNTLNIKTDQLDIYLEGEFYYYVENETTHKITDNVSKVLTELFGNHGIEEIQHVIEGMYCGFAYDKQNETVSVFSDSFNRKIIYYTEEGENIVVSTELTDVVASFSEISYDQNSLYSYLLLGYSPINDTFYKNVKRLGADEVISISSNGISKKSHPKPKNILDYDKTYIDTYDFNIKNAVQTRASDKGNTIMNSGGWDSTSIAYLLTENFDKKNINSIVFEVLLSDKQSFNVYEVDKVRRISDHFGIETEKCVIDYGNNESVDLWERNLEKLRETHTYFWLHHIKLADQVGAKAVDGLSVFSGEASDSIHNFGYSQFVSVNYDNMFLREYADKGKSFLYGPTFLEKIEDGSYAEDKVFNFFSNYYGNEKFELPNSNDKKDAFYKYLQAFTLSYPRVPFAKWKNTTIVKDALNTQFTNHLNDNYFSDLVNNMDNSNLYYNLLQTYKRFHFQSAQIHIANVAFSKFDMSCKMPFLDKNMVDYMYSMPENWGRGLELKTTKYPLRYLANERWDGMPLHILEEKGPHSYIAENDKKWTYAGGNWDIYCEILYKSVFTDYFKDTLSKVKVEKYLSDSYFETEKLNKIIKDYIEGVEDIPNHGILFKLALLFSIGLIEK